LFAVAAYEREISRVSFSEFLKFHVGSEWSGYQKVQEVCWKSSQKTKRRTSEFLKVHEVAERSDQINSGVCVVSAQFGVNVLQLSDLLVVSATDAV
jgi:hypothetical protein